MIQAKNNYQRARPNVYTSVQIRIDSHGFQQNTHLTERGKLVDLPKHERGEERIAEVDWQNADHELGDRGQTAEADAQMEVNDISDK